MGNSSSKTNISDIKPNTETDNSNKLKLTDIKPNTETDNSNKLILSTIFDGSKMLNISHDNNMVVKIACGEKHNLCLLKNGRLLCWEVNAYNQCVIPNELIIGKKIKDITCGYNHSIIFLSDGSIIKWGFGGVRVLTITDLVRLVEQNKNTSEIAIPANISIEKILCGYDITIILLSNNIIIFIGYKMMDQLLIIVMLKNIIKLLIYIIVIPDNLLIIV